MLSPLQIIVGVGVVAAAVVLIRIWTGAMNVSAIEDESLSAIEKTHPYLPKMGAILVSVLVAGILLVLSLKYGTKTSLSSFTEGGAWIRTLFVFGAIAAFGLFDQSRWRTQKDRYKYFFAFVLGTLVTWILIAFKRSLFEADSEDPFLIALGVTCIVIGWKFLFGPWSASVKATVLGSFIFWSAYALLRFAAKDELIATAVATGFALIPGVIWCWLFLAYHRQRIAVVVLAFFAGMLSTAPILFYSELSRRSLELNFFLFKVVPINFGSSSQDFVANSFLKGTSGSTTIVLTTLVTYLVVGTIEELSKFWVLRHSSKEFFRSIDDVLQLAIVVAIGFAFAENLVNPTYYVGFVRQFLLGDGGPQWGAFLGSVVGRSVLTTMVHILSTGVLGYFFGLAFFASPLLKDQFSRGKAHPFFALLHQMLAIRTDQMYARAQIVFGLLAAIALHAAFDFTVSISDVLPGHPATVGALLGLAPSSLLSGLSITLLPSVLYVVGGFWLLTYLFERKEDMKEFGAIIETQVVVE